MDLMGNLSKGVAQATLEQLRVGTDLAKGVAQEALKALREKKFLEYRQWVVSNIGVGAKLLHSWTKKEDDGWANPGDQNPEPTKAMEERTCKWQGFWSPEGPMDAFPEDHPLWLE